MCWSFHTGHTAMQCYTWAVLRFQVAYAKDLSRRRSIGKLANFLAINLLSAARCDFNNYVNSWRILINNLVTKNGKNRRLIFELCIIWQWKCDWVESFGKHLTNNLPNVAINRRIGNCLSTVGWTNGEGAGYYANIPKFVSNSSLFRDCGSKCQSPQIVVGILNIYKTSSKTFVGHGERLGKLWECRQIIASPVRFHVYCWFNVWTCK